MRSNVSIVAAVLCLAVLAVHALHATEGVKAPITVSVRELIDPHTHSRHRDWHQWWQEIGWVAAATGLAAVAAGHAVAEWAAARRDGE